MKLMQLEFFETEIMKPTIQFTTRLLFYCF